MTKKEAIKALSGFTIEYSGQGDKVISTSPSAGARIKEGNIVKIMLNWHIKVKYSLELSLIRV